MEELILNKARGLFFSYGLKSTSMDDLAKLAGVSKKTIYQSVADKNSLVEKVVEDLMHCHKGASENCRVEATNAVEEVVLQTEKSYRVLAAINYNFFYELEKFFPAVWAKVALYRQETLLPYIRQNIERGIREDVYRADLDVFFIANVRLQQLDTALNGKGFHNQNSTAQQLMMQLTHFYLHGITNGKGKKLITKYITENNAK